MSLIGGFNFGPNDRTEQSDGVPHSPHTKDILRHERHLSQQDETLGDPETTHKSKQHVASLARQFSRDSLAGKEDIFNYVKGSHLDPFSETFDAQQWTKQLTEVSRNEGRLSRTSGVAFRNLGVYGYGSEADYQQTVGNIFYHLLQQARDHLGHSRRKVQILTGFDGVLDSGEMLVVLGPPGSGCTTFLKTIAGNMHGIYLDEGVEMNYRGITLEQMNSQFRGESIYTAEVDVHFPKLLVGDTLAFAARARAPVNPPGGLSQAKFASYMKDIVMAVFGITHTINTKVGNDFIRGVSGGERKRVTIAEATLAGAPLQCWDNSTRGLDSANALQFCKTIRAQTEYFGTTAVVAIYQAPQVAYDIFDKVSVIYDGQQIFYGRCDMAKDFFVRMGFHCPREQTTPDFLTSLTSPNERQARWGFEHTVPTNADEFVRRWKASPEYEQLLADITAFEQRHPVNGEEYDKFLASRRQQQSKHARVKSPYTLSYGGQIKLCLIRGYQRLASDPSMVVAMLIGNSVMALITSSIFYNLPSTTGSFFSRCAALFFAILLNAFSSALEILTQYAQRPIVEKHNEYAFYRPSAEAFASILCDIPYKLMNAVAFNTVTYFMVNLRREPGAFFFFFLVTFLLTMTMSMLFRAIASISRTREQAMPLAGLMILSLVLYTGFTIPKAYMLGWASWIRFINPIGYGFESLLINEFTNRNFTCSQFIPSMGPYVNVTGLARVCTTVGAAAGADFVNGDTYLWEAYGYKHSHKWRNVGFIICLMLFFMFLYLLATESIQARKSKGEVLIYPRLRIPDEFKHKGKQDDAEAAMAGAARKAHLANDTKGQPELEDTVIQKQTSLFSWQDVTLDIKIKGEPRRLLDHVDGWVKPGTLTALMGVSGAGKTVLLDTLAERMTLGVIGGDVLVDGSPRDQSFQRKIGYVQQQDLHLETSTVREALRFSACLRQPRSVPRKEKYDYVEEILKLLEMDTYAEAVVGTPGEGLNVEQRKRLTIAVELVAKPQLLLFLDEPTSGLDSQTSWNILKLLEKLTAHQQAILCTIHQPSAMLFQQFDRLLFLAKGGRPVYFGKIGKGSSDLVDYFVRNGAPPPPKGGNPAEWIFNAIGAAPGSHTDVDWVETWNKSPEKAEVHAELTRIRDEGDALAEVHQDDGPVQDSSYAAPFGEQLREVYVRIMQQYWRTPTYIWSKFLLTSVTGLFIGFSFFKAGTSQQGLQNQLFSVFMVFTTFGQLSQQIMPTFVTQRSLYEVRERPSRTYSWIVFMMSNILAEIPWDLAVGTIMFCQWYYPPGFYRNAIEAGQVTERGGLMWLYLVIFMLFISTFTHMVVAGVELAETASFFANFMFSMSLIFCGVMVPRSKLPGFWKFMNRVSPFTYFVEGMLSVATANTEVVCAANEYRPIVPPGNLTCAEYMGPYMAAAGGYLKDPSAITNCEFCAISSTNTFLKSVDVYYSHRWRNWGLIWVYIVFNISASLLLYWFLRVPHKKLDSTKEGKHHHRRRRHSILSRRSSRASHSSHPNTAAETPVVTEKAPPLPTDVSPPGSTPSESINHEIASVTTQLYAEKHTNAPQS